MVNAGRLELLEELIALQPAVRVLVYSSQDEMQYARPCVRLFKKNARGTVRATEGESSSGLELFIVKTLAELKAMCRASRSTARKANGAGRGLRVEWPRA